MPTRIKHAKKPKKGNQRSSSCQQGSTPSYDHAASRLVKIASTINKSFLYRLLMPDNQAGFEENFSPWASCYTAATASLKTLFRTHFQIMWSLLLKFLPHVLCAAVQFVFCNCHPLSTRAIHTGNVQKGAATMILC